MILGSIHLSGCIEGVLADIMAKKGKDDKGLQELQTVSLVSLPTVFVLYVELYLLCMHK